MIEVGSQKQQSFHLAGIIPVAGELSNLHPVLPNCLASVGADYTAIQAAAAQCAYAGCETIWIVCNDDVAPAVKHVLGDSIEDPSYRHRSFCKYPSEHRIAIPIFYVPVHPKDRDRRDCRPNRAFSWNSGRDQSRATCGGSARYIAAYCCECWCCASTWFCQPASAPGRSSAGQSTVVEQDGGDRDIRESRTRAVGQQ